MPEQFIHVKHGDCEDPSELTTIGGSLVVVDVDPHYQPPAIAASSSTVHPPIGSAMSGFYDSSSNISNSNGDICRICHCESDVGNPLMSPCYCSGSLKYVHQSCLQQWLAASDTRSCELCKFNFILHTKIKPISEWRRLEMSSIERRRLLCAILFHFVAAVCVVWSLFVLIDRAAEEVQKGIIAWPFWTKLVVVAVGFTGGAVFMYIQCRQYLHLFSRWKAHNRIILVQNAPEKQPLPPPSPTFTVTLNPPPPLSLATVSTVGGEMPNGNVGCSAQVHMYSSSGGPAPKSSGGGPGSLSRFNGNGANSAGQKHVMLAKVDVCPVQYKEPLPPHTFQVQPQHLQPPPPAPPPTATCYVFAEGVEDGNLLVDGNELVELGETGMLPYHHSEMSSAYLTSNQQHPPPPTNSTVSSAAMHSLRPYTKQRLITGGRSVSMDENHPPHHIILQHRQQQQQQQQLGLDRTPSDDLERRIQEVLALDVEYHRQQRMLTTRSAATAAVGHQRHVAADRLQAAAVAEGSPSSVGSGGSIGSEDKRSSVFKSMPNLNTSSENLL